MIAGGKFLLVSYKEAISRPVYLPDFAAINQQFADREARTGVVHDVILREFADLREDGIRSLRDFLIGRGEIRLINPGGPAEQRQQETVRYIQMAASGRKLISELSRVGVRATQLKAEFVHVMAQLSQVRLAEKITVHYQVGDTAYETKADAGLDENRILWLTDDASDMAPFEALAEYLFRAGEAVDTAPYKLFQAVQALRAGHGRLLIAPSDLRNSPDTDDASNITIEDDQDSAQQLQGRHATAHGAPTFSEPPVPNPTPFPAVKPQDFETSGRVTNRLASRSARTPPRGSPSERRNTVLEEIEKSQLKHDNYAYHCQACLGLHQPDSLTPKFTYLWDKDYRNRNIEAHHVEHLQNEGALGAGNLIILCQYHHDYLGDKLDRDGITRELRTARSGGSLPISTASKRNLSPVT